MGQVPCVLVVDDAIDALQTLADILGVAGYAVRTAPSAERALQILGGTSIDLVITDLRMGGMGGMGLIRSLHRDFPDLPVIALSGFADTSTVIQAFREGVVDFLVKPFTAEEVLAAVERALARRRGPDRRWIRRLRPGPGRSCRICSGDRGRSSCCWSGPVANCWRRRG